MADFKDLTAQWINFMLKRAEHEKKGLYPQDQTEVLPSVLSKNETLYLTKAWKLLGGNDLGTLAVRKLGSILRGFGKNPTEQEVHFLKYNSGLDEHQRLTFDEAVDLYMKCKNHIDTEEKLNEAFKKFDEEGSGFIMATELRDIMVRLGELLSKDELEEMIRDADIDRNGRIDYTGTVDRWGIKRTKFKEKDFSYQS